MLAPAVAACIQFAAATQHLPPSILAIILDVEGGQVGTASPNTDGSHDLGPAQINTFWIDEVAKAASRTKEQAAALLQWNGCFNIRVEAAILRYEINHAGGNFWAGVMHYHSHDPAEATRYLDRVVGTAIRLYGPGIFAHGHTTAGAQPSRHWCIASGPERPVTSD
jgi:hypothetical protein